MMTARWNRIRGGRHALLTIACGLLFARPCRAQPGEAGPKAPERAYTCVLQGGFERADSGFSVAVKGTTDLPEGAILALSVYYLKPPSAIFIHPNRPPPPPDPLLLDGATVALKDRRFEARLWPLKRVPYAGAYRVAAVIHWPDQPAFLRGDNPDERDPLEWTADLAYGKPEDLAAEREETLASVKGDLSTIAQLQRELAEHARRCLRDAAAAASWAGWMDVWRRPMALVKSRNGERLEYGVVWAETQGKYRVQDLSERLETLAQGCAAAVTTKVSDLPDDIVQQERDFRAIYEGALDLLGFLKPVDPAVVREHLGPVAADFQRVEALAARLSAPASAGRPEATRAAVEALQKEVGERLPERFGALLAEAPAQAVEPATAYSEAIAEFFNSAAAIAKGEAKADDAFRKKLETARQQLKRLQEMLATE